MRESKNLLNNKQGLLEFYRLPVLYQHLDNFPGAIGLDGVHDFHRFNNTERITGSNSLAYLDERVGVGGGRRIKRADHGCIDFLAG